MGLHRLGCLPRRLRELTQHEDGAVTIDWVILTAGIVVLGVVAAGGLSLSLEETGLSIAAKISMASTINR